MRKQIAAANWKMNKTIDEGKSLLESILNDMPELSSNQQVIFAVPFPYLIQANEMVGSKNNVSIAAQNCHHLASGAFTGEVSVAMLD